MKKNTLIGIIVFVALVAVAAIIYYFSVQQTTFNLGSNTFYSFTDCYDSGWCSGCGGASQNWKGEYCQGNPQTPSKQISFYGYTMDTTPMSMTGGCPDTAYCTACRNQAGYMIKNVYIPIYYNGKEIGKLHNYKTDYTSSSGIVCNNALDATAYINLVDHTVSSTPINASNLVITKQDSMNNYAIFGWVTYTLNLKEDLFEVNITPLKTHYITGENLTINVHINNKFGSIYSNICVNGRIKTIFGDTTQKYCKGQTLLPAGESDTEFTLPITQVPTQELDLYPSAEIWLDKSQVSGVIFNYAHEGLSWKFCSGRPCEHAMYSQGATTTWATVTASTVGVGQYIGSVDLNAQTVALNPKPMFLVKESGAACPSGYVVGDNNDYCIDSGLKQLSCVQLGCPIIEGHEYQCTSAGICAETVFTQKLCTENKDCPTSTTCDAGSGLCIKTEIYDNFIQCTNATECPKPCEGVAITCQYNKCQYDDVCTMVVPTEVGCKQLGCNANYDCNTERNVCERTIITTTGDMSWLIYIVIGVAVVAIIFFALRTFLKKGKRK